MTMREIGRVFGLLVAITFGGIGTLTAQEEPQPRSCSGDTTRGEVLGRPVMRGGMMRGGMMRGEMMRGEMMRGEMMHGGMMHGGMMHGGTMSGAGKSGPAAMLLHRDGLGLSPDQIQRLEVLAATHKRATEEMMPQALRGVADLMAAASGEIDIDAARAAYDRLSRVVSEMIMTDLQLMKDARQALTPEQRTRWDAMRDEMGVMKLMMGSMMMGRMGPMSGSRGPMMPHRHHGEHHGGHPEQCR